MSARSLLDIVSFKNLHDHKQPVVVIERLRNEILKADRKSNRKANPKVTVNKIKKKVHNMRLRPSQGKKVLGLKRKAPQRAGLINAPSQDTLDDDRPLTYFAKQKQPKRKTLKPPIISKNTAKLGHKINESAVVPLSGYYSAQEIHRWMTASLPSPREAGGSSPSPGEDLTMIERGEHFSEPPVPISEPAQCPAINWITTQHVSKAPKNQLQRRCMRCDQCKRISQHIKLTKLLISQIDVPEPELEKPVCTQKSTSRRGQTKDARKARLLSPGDGENLYVELLDADREYKHYLIKIRIHKKHAKQVFSGCVVPRSSAKTIPKFNMQEHEDLIAKLVETLEPPSSESAKPQSTANLPSLENQTEPAKKKTKKQEILSKPDAAPLEIPVEPALDVPIEPIPSQALAQTAEPQTLRSALSGLQIRFVDEEEKLIVHQSEGSEAEVPAAPVQRTISISSSESIKDIKLIADVEMSAQLLEAPVFKPTKEEFADPISYFESIMPTAAKFGLCKIVAPKGFKPKCNINDDIRFDVSKQYISRLYSRWGPVAREICAIKACLQQQNVNSRPPLVDGMEVNLPKLYHLVQQQGGLENVINKKRWAPIADAMFKKTPHTEKRLDQIYVKYLLPYDTLTHKERQEMMVKIENGWSKKHQKLVLRASNPLHRKKKLLGESDSSGEETEDETADALAEAEDCVVPGTCMNLTKFKKIAAFALLTHFNHPTSFSEMEEKYWQIVLMGNEHVCVNTASIDTGVEGYGFTKNTKDPYGRHPWNLKMLSQNDGNVLRALGPVLGVTVPTLHLGMVFSTSCWHRDPHSMPWLEYMHTGPAKIWYGISDEQSDQFRRAVETLCPALCQNKAMWLSSDIAMIPPSLLMDHNVTLSRVEQYPGEYILVFPKAYSCSISTGYTESESVYFANKAWLEDVMQVFQETKESCEPTMFSLEQLLIAIVEDAKTPISTLSTIYPHLKTIIANETKNREELKSLGLTFQQEARPKRQTTAWNVRDQDECDICRCTLYLSKVRGCTDKKASVCLEDALELLKKPQNAGRDISSLEGFVTFTDVDLVIVSDAMKELLHMRVYNT